MKLFPIILRSFLCDRDCRKLAKYNSLYAGTIFYFSCLNRGGPIVKNGFILIDKLIWTLSTPINRKCESLLAGDGAIAWHGSDIIENNATCQIENRSRFNQKRFFHFGQQASIREYHLISLIATIVNIYCCCSTDQRANKTTSLSDIIRNSYLIRCTLTILEGLGFRVPSVVRVCSLVAESHPLYPLNSEVRLV